MESFQSVTTSENAIRLQDEIRYAKISYAKLPLFGATGTLIGTRSLGVETLLHS